MQDIILEPYGAQILKLSVGATTGLTALLAGGALIAFALSARALQRGVDPYRLAAIGVLAGLVGFSAIIFAGPLASTNLFRFGTLWIGFGSGLFSVGTLIAAMALETRDRTGLALGAWGAAQATAAGVAIAAGGALRDIVSSLAMHGDLGNRPGPAIDRLLHCVSRRDCVAVRHARVYRTAGTSFTARFLYAVFFQSNFQLSQLIHAKESSMQTGAITGYIDVAQLALYAFWIFFAGLVYYLRGEDKREGYPLETEARGRRGPVQGFPPMPKPKTYLLQHGGIRVLPNYKNDQTPLAAVSGSWIGSPIEPTGDPMIDGVGPAAYANRSDEPDLTYEGHPRIVPLRTAPGFGIDAHDPRSTRHAGACHRP